MAHLKKSQHQPGRQTWATLMLSAGLLACPSANDSQLVIVVDTNYLIPSDLTAVTIHVMREGSTEGERERFDLTDGSIPLPFSIGVLPPDDNPDQGLTVEVIPEGPAVPSGGLIVRKSLSHFASGARTLAVFIAKECANETCGPGSTCTEQLCVPEAITPETLPVSIEGEELKSIPCRPGETSCSADKKSVLSCPVYGSPQVTTPCATDETCSEVTHQCEGKAGGTTHILTITKGAGAGNGTVTSDPPGINCPTTCEATFMEGTSVSLTAQASADSDFLAWGPPCALRRGECRVVMNAGHNVSANFKLKSDRGLSVVVIGGGSASIRAAVVELSCDDECAFSFPTITTVSIEAKPDAGFEFLGWSGDCSGDPCTFDMASDRTVTLEFAPVLQVEVRGSGQVESDPSGINCEPDCALAFAFDSILEMRARPNEGHTFKEWQGACNGRAQCTLSMRAPMDLVAVFEPAEGKEQQVSVHIEGKDFGQVKSAPDNQIVCADKCWGFYGQGDRVTLVAEPTADGHFLGWSGPCTGSELECTFEATAFTEVTAEFGGIFPFDLNDDAADDLVFASSSARVGAFANAGSVYIQFGPLEEDTKSSADSVNRTYDGQANDELGSAFSLAGDLTGDKIPDLVVGAPGRNLRSGAVFIIPGGTDLMGSGSIDNAPIVLKVEGSPPNLEFGSTLTPIRDLNEDGYPELIVGAPASNALRTQGRAYVFLGGPKLQSGAEPALIIQGESTGDRFGAQVANVGDIGGDGLDDILISAPRYRVETLDVGAVYLFSGMAPSGLNVSVSAQTASAKIVGPAPSKDDPTETGFGASVTGLGDWNARGRPDFAVGTPGGDKVYIFFGEDDIRSGAAQDAGQMLAAPGKFGASLSGGIDYSGDEYPDLLVGAPTADTASRGRVYLYLGGPDAQRGDQPLIFRGHCKDECLEEGFGSAVGPAGDLNEDGWPDFAGGALFRVQGEEIGGRVDRGRLAVFFGGPDLTPTDSGNAPVSILGEDFSGNNRMVLSRTW